MFDKQSMDFFINKVPDLSNLWRLFLTAVYAVILSALCVLFFGFLNGLAPYMPLVSQFIMALVVTGIGYLHLRQAAGYRDKYGTLAYRRFFYELMIPYLVTWYACFFHPLFVDGAPLLPTWLAVALGTFCLLLMVLASIHIERAGFHMMTHGMDVYTVFPDEATIVHGKIYAYVRHPLYFSLTVGAFGLAFLRNNPLALGVALLQMIPCIALGYMEDVELVERVGDTHRAYIKQTALLLPLRRLWGFLKLLFFAGE